MAPPRTVRICSVTHLLLEATGAMMSNDFKHLGDTWIEGWAVLLCTRTAWDLRSFHAEMEPAAEAARALGNGYECVQGFHRPGTDAFLHRSAPDSSTLPLMPQVGL